MTKSRITLQTFGFKYGHPQTNFWFDVSFLKNPVRRPGADLRDSFNEEMVEFIRAQNGTNEIVKIICETILLISTFDDDVRIGIGCNSGRHRSRAIAQIVLEVLNDSTIKLIHREDIFLDGQD